MDINIKQFRATLAMMRHVPRPIMAWGPPGVGKSVTALAEAVDTAKEMKLAGVLEYGDLVEDPQSWYGFMDVRLTDKDPVDMGGLPDKDETNGTMVRLAPDWWPHEGRTDLPDHGMVMLDEAPSAPPSVQATAYAITQERRIGAYKLKPGWRIVMAGNRTTDGGVSFKMPTPLANRVCHLYLHSDHECWLEIAPQINIHPMVMAFIKMRPDLMNTFEEYTKKGRKGHAFATERSWHALSDVVHGVDLMSTQQRALFMPVAKGLVGDGPGTEFSAMIDVWKSMPNIDYILTNPHDAEVPTGSATLYAVTTALAAKCNAERAANIMAYLARLPPEFTVKTFTDLKNREGGLHVFETQEYIQWASQNHHLF